jgi:TonB family protein
LKPGSFPGAEDCLGEGQTWGEDGFLSYVALDELPEAIQHVEPTLPPSYEARGIDGSLVVNVLVCRSGRVIDAYASWPQDATPDRKLEQSAIEAAMQWVFIPGSKGGRPFASWIAIPMRFH